MSLTNKINVLSEINTGDNVITASALSEGLTESAASAMTYTVGSLKYSVIGSGENAGYYRCDGVDGEGVGNVEIASKVNDIEVREIAVGAFEGETKITSFTIPNTILKINASAFYGTRITSIAIPYSVKEIGDEAFKNCYYLETVTFKTHPTKGTASLTTLGNEVFYMCSKLGDVSLPDSLTSMGKEVFRHCTGLYQIHIGNGLTEIKYGTFWSCDELQTVVWGESVTSIGDAAFYRCSALRTHRIPQSVTWIGQGAYDQSGLVYLSAELELDDGKGWFYTDSPTVPTEIKDGETCTHVATVQPFLLATQFANKYWFKLDQIPAPTISINDGVLTVTDYSGLAETFKIYVNAGDPIEISSTPTIVPGTWVGNDTLSMDDNLMGTSEDGLIFTSIVDDTEISFDVVKFIEDTANGTQCLVYGDLDGENINYSYVVAYNGTNWTDNKHKTIVITEVGDVSADFAAWFLANFTLVV